jgi:hypothetical protein
MRVSLLIDPLRILCFVLGLIVLPLPSTFAAIYLLFFLISVPVFYRLKDEVLPTRYGELWKNSWKSGLVSIASLLPALVIALVARHDESGVAATFAEVFLGGLLMLPCWLVGVIATKHPLSRDAIFARVLNKARASIR